MLSKTSAIARALVGFGLASAFAHGAPASVAFAHSPPFAVSLSWSDPASSALPIIVTTRGLVFANGASPEQGFSIRCNEAYGANTSDRPNTYQAADGTLTVGVYNSVFRSNDRGCTLTPATGLPMLQFTSLLGSASAPQRLYVGVRDLMQASIYASEDSGRTFEKRFGNKVDQYYETVVVAPSDSLRLYALGLDFDRVNLKVIFYSAVSVDGGKSWENTVTDAKITPLGVHPTKPDVVFAYRATDKTETTFDLLRSEDRGKNYKVVLANTYQPTGFAALKGTLYVGASLHDEFYQSTDDGQTFTRLLAGVVQRITCLAEHAGKLWMCANIAPNLDGIWTLKDDASGVDKVMSFEAVTAPVPCSDAAAREQCALPWHDFDLELHPPADDAGVADGGLSDAASPAQDAGVEVEEEDGSVASERDAEAEPDAELSGPQRHRDRCQFGVGGDVGGAGWVLSSLLGLLVWRRRRG